MVFALEIISATVDWAKNKTTPPPNCFSIKQAVGDFQVNKSEQMRIPRQK